MSITLILAYFSVDMSKNPNRKLRLGKETMTRNLWREREAANPHVPKRARGWIPIDGEESSELKQS